jgi:hypothetical protein
LHRDGEHKGTKDLTGSFFEERLDFPKELLSKTRPNLLSKYQFSALPEDPDYEVGMYELEPAAEDGQGKKHRGTRISFEV